MKIICHDEAGFFDAIAACVKRGLTFEADHHALIIKLTGGF